MRQGLFFSSSARWHFDKLQIAQCLKRHIVTIFITMWYKEVNEAVLQIIPGRFVVRAHCVDKNQEELFLTEDVLIVFWSICENFFISHLKTAFDLDLAAYKLLDTRKVT